MKKTTKKSPTGAPLGNPLKFFREGGEKIKTMFKTGGYNVPTQSLPKASNGNPLLTGSRYPKPVGREFGDGPSYNPYTPKPKYGPMTEEESMKVNFPNGPTVMNTPMDPYNLDFLEPKMKIRPNGYPNPYKVEEKDGGMMKKGGTTKTKKFAALAPPFNKATAADRIAGAKKNVRKKK